MIYSAKQQLARIKLKILIVIKADLQMQYVIHALDLSGKYFKKKLMHRTIKYLMDRFLKEQGMRVKLLKKHLTSLVKDITQLKDKEGRSD